MQNQLLKAIKLAKKTGDKLIVFDRENPDSIYVVMALDEYERIVMQNSDVRGLTEQQMLDRINRDIAVWKSDQDTDAALETFNSFEQLTGPERIRKNRNFWKIPADRKEGAEEIIEEDRQYLEDVPF